MIQLHRSGLFTYIMQNVESSAYSIIFLKNKCVFEHIRKTLLDKKHLYVLKYYETYIRIWKSLLSVFRLILIILIFKMQKETIFVLTSLVLSSTCFVDFAYWNALRCSSVISLFAILSHTSHTFCHM